MEDGFADGVEFARDGALVCLPVAQQENDGHHHQMGLLFGGIGNDVLQGDVQVFFLLQGENVLDEDGAELAEEHLVFFFPLAEFLRTERQDVVNRGEVFPCIAEWSGVVGLADGTCESAYILQERRLLVQAELREFVGHGLNGLDLDELELMGELCVSGDGEVIGEDGHVVAGQKGVAGKLVLIVQDGDDVAHDGVEYLLDGLGHHPQGQFLFLDVLGFFAVVVGLQQRQNFACRGGESLQGVEYRVHIVNRAGRSFP